MGNLCARRQDHRLPPLENRACAAKYLNEKSAHIDGEVSESSLDPAGSFIDTTSNQGLESPTNRNTHSSSSDEESEEDFRRNPVCSEIPWHQMNPLIDELYYRENGPSRTLQEGTGPSRTSRIRDTSQVLLSPCLINSPRSAPRMNDRIEIHKGDDAVNVDASVDESIKLQTRTMIAQNDHPQCSQRNLDMLERAKSLMQGASMLQKQGNASAACAIFKEAVKVARAADDLNTCSQALIEVCRAEFQQNHWAATRSIADELLELQPKHDMALYFRGLALEQEGSLEAARTDLVKAVSWNFMNKDAEDAVKRIDEALAVAHK